MRRQTKYAEIRTRQQSPPQQYAGLAAKLDSLAGVSNEQYEALLDSMATGGGVLYPVDMLLASVVARSLEVCEAFLQAMDSWSISIASALVRLQVDNVLRCHLFAVTPDAGGVLAHLSADQRLRDLSLPAKLVTMLPVARQRKRMRHEDWVLVALAARELDWVESAYTVSSAWVHHSAAHLLTTYQVAEDRTLRGRVPVDPALFTEPFLTNLVDVMGISSKTIVRYVREWSARKAGLGD